MFAAPWLVTLRESMRRFFKKTWRAIRYLGLFVWSILCHVLLLTLTIAPLAVPALALFVLYLEWETVEGYIGSFKKNEKLAQALSLLIGAGVLTWIITTLGKCALNQLREIGKAVRDVWSKGRSLGGKSLEDLEKSWRDYIKTAPCNAWKAFKEAKYLTRSLMLCVLLVAMYPVFAPKPKDRPVYVAVFEPRGTSPETSDLIELYMSSNPVFSLSHAKNAQPMTGEGICLDDPQQDWLNNVRKTMENCVAEDGSPPTYEVKGYASVAPIHVDGDTSDTEKLNCKVANWRAAAVGAFLADPSEESEHKKWWRCEDVEKNFNSGHPNKCGTFIKDPLDSSKRVNDKPLFRVEVHQWEQAGEMIESKPADDGQVPDPRRFEVEVLNRVVRIHMPKVSCRTTAPGAGTSQRTRTTKAPPADAVRSSAARPTPPAS